MTEHFKIEQVAADPKGFKQAGFMTAYTGIEQSQLEAMSPEHTKKVFLGLYKQLDLITMLHGKPAQAAFHTAMDQYFAGGQDIADTTAQVNSLMVWGDVRDLAGSGLEHLHERLGHFWRILGWEELGQMEHGGTKLLNGSIEEVQRSSGNLIRTLDLLAEQWKEHNVGPHLVYPQGKAKVTRQATPGYAMIKRQDEHSNTMVVLSTQNEGYPQAADKELFDAHGNLMQRLLDRYPVEIALAVYDYHMFAQGQDGKHLNTAYIQEYKKEGQTKVKGFLNGQGTILLASSNGGTYSYAQIAASENGWIGNAEDSPYENFDIPAGQQDYLAYVQGKASGMLNEHPQDLEGFTAHPGQFGQMMLKYSKQYEQAFSKDVPYAKQGKPALPFKPAGVAEYQPVEITPAVVEEAAQEIQEYLNESGVQYVNIEAGHIHADAVPTGRQKTGIKIGAQLAGLLKDAATVKKTTMIDEDHVPNTLDHAGYAKTMEEQGFSLDEVIYESSPAIREIAVSAIVSLGQKYPDHVYQNGKALMFNIPGTDLQVELIKDIGEPDVELGCVIFDVGLTLAKVYPELASGYDGGAAAVHAGMQELYTQIESPEERHAAVKALYPNATKTYEEVLAAHPLPEVANVHSAVINVLERFYDGQQVKLEGMLHALDIPIHLVDVTFSDQGLHVNMSANGFESSKPAL